MRPKTALRSPRPCPARPGTPPAGRPPNRWRSASCLPSACPQLALARDLPDGSIVDAAEGKRTRRRTLWYGKWSDDPGCATRDPSGVAAVALGGYVLAQRLGCCGRCGASCPRPCPTPPGTPPAERPPNRWTSSASCLPSACPAACACARCRRRSIWRSRPCAAP
jgi:hypothetical protein